MTRTVTYDEAQWKLVPIEPTEEMIGADIEPLYGMDMALAYKTMLNYAPPYPESNCKEILDSWIPVSARLPEIGVPVLGLTNRVDIGAYLRADTGEGDGSWIWAAFEYGYISDPRMYDVDDEYIVDAWMPLPSAPKGEE